MVGHHRLRGGDAEPMPELPEVETVMRGLAAVLEGVQAEVRQLGDVLARSPDAEHATGVLRALVLGVECCGQSAVTTGARPGGLVHGAESTGGSRLSRFAVPVLPNASPNGVSHVT